MTTEQQWLGNEPYPTSQDGPRPVVIGYYEGTTLPVCDYPPAPDSPPVITVEWTRPSPEEVLSAALEDAEGRALVEDIIERKRLTNIRERFFQQMVWGDVQTDGHGNVIPRELPEHWQHLKAAALAGGGVEYTKSLNKPERISVKIEGTRTAVAWLDEITRGLGAHLSRDPHLQVREVVTRYELTPVALTIPAVGPVRWAVAP